MGRSAGLGRKDSLYRTVAGIGEPDLHHPEDSDLRSDVGSVSVPFSLRLACDGAITVALAPPRGDQEAALLDLLGQFLGVPVAALLGAGQQRTA